MANGICDTGRNRLSFAITRPNCMLPPHYEGRGNVMQTAIGLIRDGQKVESFNARGIIRQRCAPVGRKPAGPVC